MNHRTMNTRPLRTLTRLTFGNTASRIYLGLVLAVAVFVAVDALFVSHDDASFAGVWLFFLAAPTVFVFFLGSSMAGADTGGPAWFVYLALVVSVLVQACALGWFSQLIRGSRHGRSAHPQGT
ncbi:SCO4225 family membrane protein [Streptomyces sp. NPDC056796]|uniref:SCO4225 family membrane protein n=1 Tax=Streptomyces sp. NPDC056796 TaxID=3345947 RepID=UPI003695FE98